MNIFKKIFFASALVVALMAMMGGDAWAQSAQKQNTPKIRTNVPAETNLLEDAVLENGKYVAAPKQEQPMAKHVSATSKGTLTNNFQNNKPKKLKSK